MRLLLAFVLGAALVAWARFSPSAYTIPKLLIPASPQAQEPVPPQAQSQASPRFKVLLQPVYNALTGGVFNALQPQAIGRFRVMFTMLPQSEDRDAALRFIGIAERGASFTVAMSERYNRPSPRTSAVGSTPEGRQAEKAAATNDAFFKQGILAEWQGKMRPIIATAAAEWAKIPDTAASPLLTDLARASHIAAKTVEMRIKVSQVIEGGVLATPYESYSVASEATRFGLGGKAASGSRPGSRTVFITGVRGVSDDQRLNVSAYRDGIFHYTDILGAPRTVEKWILVKLVPEK